MKKSDNQLDLVNRALKIAAVEAYQEEIEHAHLTDLVKGSNQTLSRREWIKDRIERWLDEAELEKS